MPSCDTCALLKVPENSDHAQNYRICGWQPRTMPEPVLQLEKLALRRMSAARWITLKVLKEDPSKLPPCSCWEPRGEANVQAKAPQVAEHREGFQKDRRREPAPASGAQDGTRAAIEKGVRDQR
jgi:hypothetical protein